MPVSRTNSDEGFPRAEWATTWPTARVARLRERLLTETRRVDLERARITTESYRRTEGAPMPVRRAVMLHDLARGTSIAIAEGERIVGNRSLAAPHGRHRPRRRGGLGGSGAGDPAHPPTGSLRHHLGRDRRAAR